MTRKVSVFLKAHLFLKGTGFLSKFDVLNVLLDRCCLVSFLEVSRNLMC